ncbi:hypothetical protein BH10BAC1_BH10BAC1_12040 [soil metagenome]
MTIELFKEKEFFIVDTSGFWSDFSYCSLTSTGCKIKKYTSYKYLKVTLNKFKEKPDLIIIGCSKPNIEEIELVEFLHHNNFRQIVLCSFLSWDEMRELFLAGADDVTEKPFDSEELIETIKESLNNMELCGAIR